MNGELSWLAYTILMTALFWVPYVLNRMGVRGIWGTMQNPVPDKPGLAEWALRAKAAHDNAVSNLVIFAPLVLMISHLGAGNANSVLACQIYFWARLVHFVVYTAGLPGIRTLSFLTGWGAQLWLLWILLG